MAGGSDKMVIRRLSLAVALVLMGACTLWQGMSASKPVADCPTVIRSSAWVDKMPTIGSEPHKLMVAVKVDDERPWLLTPVSTDDPSVRSLALSPGGPAVAGNASYREQISHPMPLAISISCGGRELARIDKIKITM